MIFMGRSGPPASSVSAHIRVSISLDSHFIFLFFSGPGQFTKRLLIISADAKGKDSMILFKIKETAHIISGHVLLSFGSHVMMALTQENVHYTSNSSPGVMNKSNRVHARIQDFLSGGGGGGGEVEARRPENSLDNVFLVINLFYSLQSGSNGFITEGRRGSNFFQGVGVSKETHIICDFPERRGGGGGPDPLIPLWIRTWGRLTPLFAYRIMVYQNLNKTEKYHPTTIKREKKLSPAGRDSKCGSRAGSGGPDPPGKLQVIWVSIEYKQLDPLEKVGPPLENVGPPLEP